MKNELAKMATVTMLLVVFLMFAHIPATRAELLAFTHAATAQLRQSLPMIMLPQPMQSSIKSIAAMTPEQFETWIMFTARKLRDSGKKPDVPKQELLVRLKAGKYVTDNSVLILISASEASEKPFTPSGRPVHNFSSDTLRLIDLITSLVYDRPNLAAELHRRKAELYDAMNDRANAVHEYAEAVRLLTPLHVAIDEQRIDSLVQEAGLLYQQGKRQQAEDLYLEALSYGWFNITDPEAVQFFQDSYIRAGRGLIECRRRNLAALKEIYFVPAANDELQPVLQKAIKEAEGLNVQTPQVTK